MGILPMAGLARDLWPHEVLQGLPRSIQGLRSADEVSGTNTSGPFLVLMADSMRCHPELLRKCLPSSVAIGKNCRRGALGQRHFVQQARLTDAFKTFRRRTAARNSHRQVWNGQDWGATPTHYSQDLVVCKKHLRNYFARTGQLRRQCFDLRLEALAGRSNRKLSKGCSIHFDKAGDPSLGLPATPLHGFDLTEHGQEVVGLGFRAETNYIFF